MITENLTIQIQIKKTEAQLPHPLFLKVTDWKQIPQFLMEITSSLKKGISHLGTWYCQKQVSAYPLFGT